MPSKKITALSICWMCIFVVMSNSHVDAGVIVESFNSLSHGDIVSRSDGGTTVGSFNGFTVSGNNLNDGRDWIVAFDTFAQNTNDPDLEDPFDVGNAHLNTNHPDLVDPTIPSNWSQTASRFQRALIIQEAGVGQDIEDSAGNPGSDGKLDNPNNSSGPNDEGDRPAGSISFDFIEDITSFGFDLLDVEGVTVEDGSVQFFSNGSEVASVGFIEFLNEADRQFIDGSLSGDGDFYDASAPVEFGNNSANRIIPITAAALSMLSGGSSISGFDEVTINLGGSGAVDNISFSTPEFIPAVPEPTAFFVWAMIGVIGLFDNRRKARA